jgi:hypothetical protein
MFERDSSARELVELTSGESSPTRRTLRGEKIGADKWPPRKLPIMTLSGGSLAPGRPPRTGPSPRRAQCPDHDRSLSEAARRKILSKGVLVGTGALRTES